MSSKIQRVGLIGLSGLLLLGVSAFFFTRPADYAKPRPRAAQHSTATAPEVDESLSRTARSVRPLASTQDEDQLAAEVVRQADHEVSLAYTMALRKARLEPPAQTPAAKALSGQITSLQGQLAGEESEIARLNKSLEKANANQADDLHDRLELLQAQKGLDQEELEDAQQDLIEAGGDREGAIQQKFKEYEALQRSGAGAAATSRPASLVVGSSLLTQASQALQLWKSGKRLSQAQQEAERVGQESARKAQELSQRLRGDRKAIGPVAANSGSPRAGSRDQRSASLAAVKSHVEWRRQLADHQKEVSDSQQLSKLYGEWAGIVKWQMFAVLHGLVRSVLWLLLIALSMIVADLAIDRHISKLGFERRQRVTMRMVLRLALRALGALCILTVLFGPPTQLSTIVAFAGAGLTVAMKDFIVAFFGWFVLMGKNGIHVGDWVEINGIGGEVVEVGLLKTVLMETGNWTDSGHPTGRKVSFVNSFAMEGHYFNFTTKGQWMWDELDVLVPAGADPYVLMAGIQRLVEEETRSSSAQAELEWQKETHNYGVQAFTAKPAINIRPTAQGLSVQVRYITQANERYDLRTKLYKDIVELMRNPAESGAAK